MTEKDFPAYCLTCEAMLVGTELMICDECIETAPDEPGDSMDYVAEAKRKAFAKIWREKVPVEYRNTEAAKLNAKAREIFPELASWKYGNGHGLTFIGPTGEGKTRLAVEAMRAAFDAGARCEILRAANLRMQLWESYEAAGKIVARATKPDVLIFDDIGQGAKSEQIDEVTLAILEQRTADRKPTLTTTQFGSKRLVERFHRAETGEAILRRVGQQFATIYNLNPTKKTTDD